MIGFLFKSYIKEFNMKEKKEISSNKVAESKKECKEVEALEKMKQMESSFRGAFSVCVWDSDLSEWKKII
jgi:hypothetical protein